MEIQRTGRKRKTEETNYQSNVSDGQENNTDIAGLHHGMNQLKLDTLKLSYWSLPNAVSLAYGSKGIEALFPWQQECLQIKDVLKGRNLVYSAPTSAGKTLVAEFLIIKTLYEQDKKAVFILPFKAVVREKAAYLSSLLQNTKYKVGAFMGNISPPGGLASVDVAVCVTEKANSLVNKLMAEGGLGQLGIVVVDELHQIGDSSRGYLLELLLTKLINEQQTPRCPAKIQLVGMSATLPNLPMLSTWLDAALYVTDFRPVPLTQFAMCGRNVYDVNQELLGVITPRVRIEHDDTCVSYLCLKTALEGKSSLVFCMSKAHVEAQAAKIASDFKRLLQITEGESDMSLRTFIRKEPIEELLEQLKRSPVGAHSSMHNAISNGVGIHHAGLSEEERDIVEMGFRNGALRVVVSTSTLCSGVNLPARVVIVRYNQHLTRQMYQQMVGRAGRKGVDTSGESYLVLNSNRELTAARNVMDPQLPPIKSCLWHRGELANSLKQAVLEVIASEVACTKTDVLRYMCNTLMFSASQDDEESKLPLEEAVNSCLNFLEQMEFIKSDKAEDNRLIPLRLSKACLAAAMSPDEALELYKELEQAQNKFVLKTELHLLYMAVPHDGVASTEAIDWLAWLTKFNSLSENYKFVASVVGVRESFISAMIGNKANRVAQSTLINIAKHARFRKALALCDLVLEASLDEVAEELNWPRGRVQSLQHAAAAQAGRVKAFCRELGWNSMEVLMDSFQDRLYFGVQIELCELVRVSLLNKNRARGLFNAGYTTLASLAQASECDIEKVLINLMPYEMSRQQRGEGWRRCQDRHKEKALFVTGKEGLTEKQAARLIVHESRRIVESDLGGILVSWSGQTKHVKLESIAANPPIKDSEVVECPQVNECPGFIGRLQMNVSSSELIQSADSSVTEAQDDTSEPKTEALNHDANSREENPNRHDACIEQQTDAVNQEVNPLNMSNNVEMESVAEPVITCLSELPVDQLQEIIVLNSDPDSEEAAVYFPQPMVESESERLLFDSYTPKARSHNVSGKLSPDMFGDSPPQQSYKTPMQTTPNRQSQRESQSPTLIEGSPERSVSACNASSLYDPELLEVLKQFDVAVPEPVSTEEAADASNSDMEMDVVNSSFASNLSDSFNNFAFMSVFEESTTTIERKLSNNNFVSKESDSLMPEFNPKLLTKDVADEDGIFQLVSLESKKVFQSFAAEWKTKKYFSLCVGCESIELSVIGERIVGADAARSKQGAPHKHNADPEYRNMKLVGVAICWGGLTSYYLDLRCTPGSEVSRAEKMALLQGMLRTKGVQLVCYNAKEQLRLLKIWTETTLHGASLGGDPLIAKWLMNPDAKPETFNCLVLLDTQGSVHTDSSVLDQATAWCLQVLESCGEYMELMEKATGNSLGMAAKSPSAPQVRAGVEACLTLHVCHHLHQQLKELQLWNVYTEVELPLVRCLVEGEVAGFCLDKQETQRLIARLENFKTRIEAEAHAVVGRSFKLNSRKEIVNVIYSTLGLTTELPCGKKTKTLATDKDTLTKLAQQHVVPRLILEFRKIDYMLSQIFYPLLQEGVTQTEDQLAPIVPSYSTTSATGRIYMREPNLQNIPRSFDLLGELVSPRTVFKARPGNTLISADYCQVELRMLAHFSSDPALLDVILHSNKDIFIEMAAKLKGVSYVSVTPGERQQAKKICYGMMYGMGAETLSLELGCNALEARHCIEEFNTKFPYAHKYMNEVKQSCLSNGYVVTLKGRKRFLPGISSLQGSVFAAAQRQAVNTVLQGSAADVTKCGMILMQRALDKQQLAASTKLVLHLHDQLMYETASKDSDAVARILRTSMESSVQLSVPLPVKMHAGPSWGLLVDLIEHPPIR